MCHFWTGRVVLYGKITSLFVASIHLRLGFKNCKLWPRAHSCTVVKCVFTLWRLCRQLFSVGVWFLILEITSTTILLLGKGHAKTIQCSCLGNLMDRGAWQATVHGVTKSWTWLSIYMHMHTWFPCNNYTLRRMPTTKKADNSQCWQGCGSIRILIYCSQE